MKKKMFTDYEVEVAANTDLVSYLSKTEGYHFTGNMGSARGVEHDSLVIKNKSFFFWHSKGTHGNAIQFLVTHKDKTFKEAMVELLSFNNLPYQERKPVEFTTKRKGTGEIKISLGHIKNAYAYLIKHRKIDKTTIDELIDIGLLKMSRVGDYPPNMAFEIQGPNGEESGYELHGTYNLKRFKGSIPDKKGNVYGFNIMTGKPKTAYFFESAIDLISFYQIKNKRDPSFLRDSILISFGGLKVSIIENMKRDFVIEKVVLCIDNHVSGDNFKEVLRKKGINFDELKVPGNNKDWNDYLVGGCE